MRKNLTQSNRTMKQTRFSQLGLGEQFDFQGTTYVKTSPLIAQNVDAGNQRMIPRSALVTISENGAPGGETPAPQSVAASAVMKAVEDYHQSVSLSLSHYLQQLDTASWSTLRLELEQARSNCLKALGLEQS